MLESNSLATQLDSQVSNLTSEIRAGLEYRVLELIIKSYKKICAEGIYPDKEAEERFSAILKNQCAFIIAVEATWYRLPHKVKKQDSDP